MARRASVEEVERVIPRKKYAFDEWSDGNVWILEEGKDYKTAKSLQSSAYAWAASRGMKAKTSIRGKELRIQFVAIEAKPKRKLRRLKKTPQMAAKLWLIRRGNTLIWTQKSGWKKTLADICEMKTMQLHAMNKNGEFLPDDFKLIQEYRAQQRIARAGK